MAASSFFFAVAVAVALLISPAFSQTCKTLKLAHKANFPNCVDLPHLNATLHWLYNSTDQPSPTLSIIYTAVSQRQGWAAWAINPTGDGMVGAQALVAFQAQNSTYIVNTYNITTYTQINESEIAYAVRRKSAAYSGGRMEISATLAIPELESELNQVWQVGTSVSGGVPDRHAMGPENTNAKGTLRLAGGAVEAPAQAPDQAPAPAQASGPSSGGHSGGSSTGGGGARVWGIGVGVYGILGLVWALYFGY